ncbi:DUF4249 domain-containing protein [Litoribacter ruber]|uniref:DUF4249 domain-containing protein n=1 Tax=Litoribacter ruber TaxID=702568 RepID=UPI001BD96E1F|nr:DUF4249 domain-containing protein [Litoribacter ruber]MBT0810548.1 DUF4249 domain-containing protein [Litoribacter ruber]
MVNFKTIIVLILLIGFSSCERYLEVEMPNHSPRFVVNADLVPGTPVMVFVSQTRGILEESDFPPVRDANVEIIEEGQQAYPLVFQDFEGKFFHRLGGYGTQELELQAGKTYHVNVDGRFESISTTVTIPQKVPIKSVEIRETSGDLVELILKFDDPQEINFYEISAHFDGFQIYQYSPDHIDSVPHSGAVRLEPLSPAYQRDFQVGSTYDSGVLIDDQLFNGNEATIEFSARLPFRSVIDLTVVLKNVTEDYYQYEVTRGLQRHTSNDPLAQPVAIHNNVEGGRGIIKAGVVSEEKVPFAFSGAQGN